MLKLGADGVRKIYAGEVPIKAAYAGGALVFGGGSPSRLPAGYTEVSYLETDMDCRIPLNYAANFTKTRLLYEVEPLSFTSSGFIISGDNVASKYFYFRRTGADEIYYRFAGQGSYSTLTAPIDGAKVLMDIDFTSKKLTVGEVSVTISANTYSSSVLYIGHKGFTCMNCRIYSLQAYESGENILEFVPCINALGVPGLYELKNGTFHENTGSGTLTAGPAV